MALKWPLPDLFKPQFSSFELQLPSLTRRSDFDDGEDRVRRIAHFRPIRQRFDLDVGFGDMAVLRRWYLEETDGGRLWFRMQAFIDADYMEIEARLVDEGNGPWVARLVGDHEYRLTLQIEIRNLPRIDDAAFVLRQWPARPEGIEPAPVLILDFGHDFFAAET